MIIAHHLIWTGYGRWLPNDPRGSTSREVKSCALAELGELHYGRKKVQPPTCVLRDFREQAAEKLKYPLLTFNVEQRSIIANSFAEEVNKQHYTCYACAIMPDHVYLIIRKHRHKAEQMLEILQSASRFSLLELKFCDPQHPIWTEGGWHGFLDNPSAVRSCIRYVEQNPAQQGMPAQSWDFVQQSDGWPER